MDYALPLYGNTLQNSELARLEQLQYRVAKIVTGTLHFTSPEKLIDDLGWKTIKKQIEILGLCIFQKRGYIPYPNYGHEFLNSFSPTFQNYGTVYLFPPNFLKLLISNVN